MWATPRTDELICFGLFDLFALGSVCLPLSFSHCLPPSLSSFSPSHESSPALYASPAFSFFLQTLMLTWFLFPRTSACTGPWLAMDLKSVSTQPQSLPALFVTLFCVSSFKLPRWSYWLTSSFSASSLNSTMIISVRKGVPWVRGLTLTQAAVDGRIRLPDPMLKPFSYKTSNSLKRMCWVEGDERC